MGSFALGYLMGMTLSGPNYTPDGYGDNFDEKELKRINDEMYWNAWDSSFKNRTIERLRNHEAGYNLLLLDGIPIYPNITQDMQADLIENGDLQIVNFKSCYAGIWADENREEAKDTNYLTKLSKIKELMKVEEYRIIV